MEKKRKKNRAALELARLSKLKTTPEQRSASARRAAIARWAKAKP